MLCCFIFELEHVGESHFVFYYLPYFALVSLDKSAKNSVFSVKWPIKNYHPNSFEMFLSHIERIKKNLYAQKQKMTFLRPNEILILAIFDKNPIFGLPTVPSCLPAVPSRRYNLYYELVSTDHNSDINP